MFPSCQPESQEIIATQYYALPTQALNGQPPSKKIFLNKASQIKMFKAGLVENIGTKCTFPLPFTPLPRKVKFEPVGKLGQISRSTMKNERTDDNYGQNSFQIQNDQCLFCKYSRSKYYPRWHEGT